MANVETTDEEASLLRAYVKTSPLILIRAKAQAVLMAAKGISLADIGFVFDRAESTVNDWLTDWHQRRLASIFTGHQNNGNAQKLTPAQRAEVCQVLQSAPSDYGLPRAFWDVPQLKRYLSATFGVFYESTRSYHFLLKFADLSFKYPDTFSRRRDEQAIAQRMAEIRQEIAPLLQDSQWEVFAADEVRIEQEAVIRRAWLCKGERTIVKVNRDRASQSYLGLLNQKTFGCELYDMPWQNQTEVLAVMRRFLDAHPGKKIAIVWDNAPFHKGREIRAALSKGGLLERVHLIALPPHAPDHNPIEHVWNVAKGEIANIQHETFDQTKHAFSTFIAGHPFPYRI